MDYVGDTSDVSKLATDPSVTIPAIARSTFVRSSYIADIVAVNGQPAKGTAMADGQVFMLRTAPKPGQAIADVTRGGFADFRLEILKNDGTPIGTIMVSELTGAAAPPGAPRSVSQGNNAIVGGTGAFLGARGQMGQTVTAQTIATG